MICSTRSPSETITGAPSRLVRVLDPAPPRLLGERRVGAVEQPAHVDLLGEDGEAVRVQLRQVEHVADEPAEPLRLGRDDLERRLGELRDRSRRPRAARRRGRGSRSAACAARARRTSGSCARAPPPRRAAPPSRGSARSRWRDLVAAGHARAPRRRSAPSATSSAARESASTGLGDPAGEVQRERRRRRRGRRGSASASRREQRHPGLAQLRLRLRDDQVRERDAALSPPSCDRVRDRDEGPVLAGRLELERDDAVAAQVDADLGRRAAASARSPAPREGRRAPT